MVLINRFKAHEVTVTIKEENGKTVQRVVVRCKDVLAARSLCLELRKMLQNYANQWDILEYAKRQGVLLRE